jgi:hypothetical protein
VTARAFAGLFFFATLMFLAMAHRRLRDRVRAEEADGLLREMFETLEHPEGKGPRPRGPRPPIEKA